MEMPFGEWAGGGPVCLLSFLRGGRKLQVDTAECYSTSWSVAGGHHPYGTRVMCVQQLQCLGPWRSRNSHKEVSASDGDDSQDKLIRVPYLWTLNTHWEWQLNGLCCLLPKALCLFEERLVLCGVFKISTLGFYFAQLLISKAFSYSTSLCSFFFCILSHVYACVYVHEPGEWGSLLRGLCMQTPILPLVGGSGEQLGITGTLPIHRRVWRNNCFYIE